MINKHSSYKKREMKKNLHTHTPIYLIYIYEQAKTVINVYIESDGNKLGY